MNRPRFRSNRNLERRAHASDLLSRRRGRLLSLEIGRLNLFRYPALLANVVTLGDSPSPHLSRVGFGSGTTAVTVSDPTDGIAAGDRRSRLNVRGQELGQLLGVGRGEVDLIEHAVETKRDFLRAITALVEVVNPLDCHGWSFLVGVTPYLSLYQVGFLMQALAFPV